MVIQRITLIPIRIPLIEPFIISLGPLTHAENVVVRMESSNGIIGWGECSPFRTIHGETIDTCMTIGTELASQVIGCAIETPEQLLQSMDKAIYGNTSIKSAFDIAFHDLLSRQQELPLYRFLGATRKRTLMTDYTVSLADISKMKNDALDIVDKGFTIIKVKLGGNPLEDVDRIRAIRNAVGPTIPIRIDANQGWTLAGAKQALSGLAKMNIQYCEEPLSRWQYRDLPSIRNSTEIPIMSDESCFNEYDAEKLVELQACDAFNIKLGKSSGMVRANRIARIARDHAIELQVGGFLESRLGFTAAAHFTWSLDETAHIDFDTPLMFSADPVDGGIRYGKHGEISMEDSPGLGVTLKENAYRTDDCVVIV